LKTARLQVLATPEFRDWLRKEAKRAGVSVGELVRSRCQQADSKEEAELAALTALLRKQVTETRASVKRNLDEVSTILRELKQQRKATSENRA
jgi:hypothetical protein